MGHVLLLPRHTACCTTGDYTKHHIPMSHEACRSLRMALKKLPPTCCIFLLQVSSRKWQPCTPSYCNNVPVTRHANPTSPDTCCLSEWRTGFIRIGTQYLRYLYALSCPSSRCSKLFCRVAPVGQSARSLGRLAAAHGLPNYELKHSPRNRLSQNSIAVCCALHISSLRSRLPTKENS